MAPTHVDTAILGAGFSGIGAAIRLDRAGRGNLLVLEGSEGVGGTWFDNTYPGAACDVRSELYSFSFAPSADWSRRYAPQAEIQRYLEGCVDRYGIRDRIRLGTFVEEARWDGALWQLRTAAGERLSAKVLVSGVGALRDPAYPALPGLDRFEGPSMHSARWDHDVPLAGRRVGVVGTGASAIQLVPELAKVASEVRVYQRTPPWVVPRDDRAVSETRKAMLRTVPGALTAARARQWLSHERRYLMHFGPVHSAFAPVAEAVAGQAVRRHISDPALRRALTPTHRIGCKRILLSDDWYPTLALPHVHVETESIASIGPKGPQLANGRVDPVDVLVYCTGFEVHRPLGGLRVLGRDGRDLAAWWGDRPRAYRGITVPGFPNLFFLLGPNTALGHSSVVLMIEAAITYLLDGWRHIDRLGPLHVREAALDAWLARVDRRLGRRVWAAGCDSWYQHAGHNPTIWPGSTVRYAWETRCFDSSAYDPA